ncbi:hypothetical protein BDV37DRAFT_238106 [Aspergillus pseudonomiae]|uniref:Uncharacterized protein n=1 Tax=Aspergillus pseudonomiae TaxID=1506151 RepID=A0A5N7DSW5_9EURO|nr:uncharacterized protein BDV37DRAFT_238106 [Aspergillus pseudonomiae]KAE8408598.1 hypothetical protein BDV37DRAFT_238106 [Aspergillus pseudonomiae]
MEPITIGYFSRPFLALGALLVLLVGCNTTLIHSRMSPFIPMFLRNSTALSDPLL